MKKFIRNFVFCLLILSISTMGLFFGINFSNKTKSFAIEQLAIETPTNSDVSIFIRKPTHSVFYNKKLFFIDDADKLLKSYNTETSAFDAEYIDLSSYKIINTSFIGSDWYLLVEGQENQNKVVKIDLAEFVIIEDSAFDLKVENKYTSLFAQQINFESKDFTFLTFSAEHENAKVALIDEETGDIETPFEIKFADTEGLNDIKESLIKAISYQDSNGKLYIIYIYDKDVAYVSFNSIDALRDYSNDGVFIDSITHTTIPDVQQLIIKNFSISKIKNKDYLAISFVLEMNYTSDFIHLILMETQTQ